MPAPNHPSCVQECQGDLSNKPATGRRFPYATLRLGDPSRPANPDDTVAAYALANRRIQSRSDGHKGPWRTSQTSGEITSAGAPFPALVAPAWGSDTEESLKPSVVDRRIRVTRSPRPETEGMAAVSAADDPRCAWAPLRASFPGGSIKTKHAQHVGRVTPVPAPTPRMHNTRTTDASNRVSAGGTPGSTFDSLGSLPLLSSFARVNRVTETMALHTLDDETDDIGEPRSAQHAQHAQREGLSFAISSRVTETVDGDLDGRASTEASATCTRDCVTRTSTQAPGADGASTSRGGALSLAQRDTQYAAHGHDVHGVRAAAAVAGPVHQTLAPTTDIGVSATDASLSDLHIRLLVRQLDLYRGADLFLGRFTMLGREQRRRGGAFCAELSVSSVLRCVLCSML